METPPQPDGIPQGVNGQEAIDFATGPAGDDLPGIEDRDDADVTEASTDFYIGKVTDLYQIRSFLIKSLRKQILADAGVLFAYCRSFWAASSVASAGTLDLR